MLATSEEKPHVKLVFFRDYATLYRHRQLHIAKFAILPHGTYCQIVWHFYRSSDARKLERIQERVLRAVYCDQKSSYEELSLAESKNTNTSYAATASHRNYNVQS